MLGGYGGGGGYDGGPRAAQPSASAASLNPNPAGSEGRSPANRLRKSLGATLLASRLASP